jgi:hypothetical protein
MLIFQAMMAIMVSPVLKVNLVTTALKVTLGPRVWWDLLDSPGKRGEKVLLVMLVKRVMEVGENF